MNINLIRERYRERARKALNKPAKYGVDIDISNFVGRGERVSEVDIESVRERVERLGIDYRLRTMKYIQVDNYIRKMYSKMKGVELYSLEEAFKERPDLIEKYFWRLINVDEDKYTAAAELYGEGGYIIVVEDDVQVDRPIQTCLLLSKNQIIQAPHNIIIVGRNSSLNVTTGCTILKEVASIHAGVTEIYLMDNAKLTYVMVHGWSQLQHVRPRTAVYLGNEAEYIDYYITFSPSKTLQMNPVVYLDGDRATAYLSSIIVARGMEDVDIGGTANLNKRNTKAEILSRVIAKDGSRVVSRSKIVGSAEGSSGHIECDGLLLSNDSEIVTIPELIAKHNDIRLTHEASIGRIAEEQILYLMSKGFNEDEAKEIIVRGFMKIDVPDLSREMRKTIEQAIIVASRGL